MNDEATITLAAPLASLKIDLRRPGLTEGVRLRHGISRVTHRAEQKQHVAGAEHQSRLDVPRSDEIFERRPVST